MIAERRVEARELSATVQQAGSHTNGAASTAALTPRCAAAQPAPTNSVSGLIALTAALVLLATLVLPKLPRGACFDDCGDLQWACLTLGVAHDPGYAGLVALGWLITKAPFLDPAYAVTLACSVSGLLALAICALLQVRAGVHPPVAAAVILFASLHPAVRDNLVVPEVYAPSAAFTLAALLAVQHYARAGRARSACLAALLLGLAVGSRPSIMLMLPGFAIAFVVAVRAHACGARWLRHAALAGACFATPCLFSIAHLWNRLPERTPDRPPTAEQAQSPVDDSTLGRAASVYRCLTGADYTFKRTSSWTEAAERSVWVAINAMPAGTHSWLLMIAPLAIFGGIRMARRDAALAWALAGVATGNLALLLLIQTGGQAADGLPLVLVIALLAGAGFARIAPPKLGPGLSAIRVMVVVAGAATAIRGWDERPAVAAENDAAEFVTRLDLAAQPPDTVVIAPWFEATAIRLAREISGRRDIRIVPSDDPAIEPGIARWLAESAHRRQPVIAAGPIPVAIERALTRRPDVTHVPRTAPAAEQ